MKFRAINWCEPDYLRKNRPGLGLTDPEIVDRMMRHVPRGRRHTAIQAGGHLGIWPARLAAEFKQVVSFEPVPELYQVCRDAIKTSRVTMLNMALSDQPKMVRMNLSRKRYSGSVMVTPSGSSTLHATAIDSLRAEWIEQVDAIMLDIEGHEIPALQGADKTIARCRPVIVVEDNAASRRSRPADAMARYMADLDYRLIERFGDDYIYVPCENRGPI